MTDQFHIDFKAIRGRATTHLSGFVCAMSVTHDPSESSESFCSKILDGNIWFGSFLRHWGGVVGDGEVRARHVEEEVWEDKWGGGAHRMIS